MKENKIVKKYMAGVADKISIFYPNRGRVLKDLKQSVEAYLYENSEGTYEDIVEEFGEPEAVAEELLELDTENGIRKNMIRCIVLLLLLVIVLALGVLNITDEFMGLMDSDIVLKEAKGDIRIQEITYQDEQKSGNLVEVTQEDVWSQENTIISGTVKTVKNIEINMDGAKFTEGIVTIQVENCLQGDLEKGSEISVLASCLVGNDNQWKENSYTNSCMNKGTRGVFIIKELKEADVLESNGCVLKLKELGNYKFQNGMCYAFVEIQEGEIIYFEDLYDDLEKPKTLEEVESYIEGKIFYPIG